MGEELQRSHDLLEEIAALRFPPVSDRRLQWLMDRNNNGALDENERQEMESMVALSETIALMRAKALHCLGQRL